MTSPARRMSSNSRPSSLPPTSVVCDVRVLWASRSLGRRRRRDAATGPGTDLGVQVLGGPPVHGEAALDIVDEQGGDEHEGAAEHDDGDEEPAEVEDAVVDDGEQGGGAGGRVDRLGEGHEGRGRGARQGAGDPADDGVAGLGEGALDRVELEHGGGAEAADDDGGAVVAEGGHVVGHELDDGDAAEDADEGPEDEDKVAGVVGLGLAVAEEAGHGRRQVAPGGTGDKGVDEPINVKVPL
ncbi:hypothetical protein BN1708_000207 [Verticillium longisporum]|uniref:Uncharacterized protein n=1 Tax=Verticillium longisporum TaxID=100787 RepID=A0A0G4KCF3_VERLO|nr:hypothetical protein BN1708_000207 [Verticillium longisporum]